MIIIFFSTAKKGPAELLLGDIKKKIHGHRIKVYRTVEALCDRFHYPIVDRAIMILMPENRERLEELISIRNLINDSPILLVLPDREPATISRGHRLYPRFVTYADGDFMDLVSVLNRLIHHMLKKKALEEREGLGAYPFSQPNASYDIRKNVTTGWKQISDTGSIEEN